ncbi:MAG TPA: hypothetical protein P5181_08665 [Dermatophilaceae bacterium]|nr:hypothetical protein [Dermatophilaceae bacterium]
MQVDFAALEEAVAGVRTELPIALIGVDIWDRETGLSLASHNSQPDASAIVGATVAELNRALAVTGFSQLGRFVLLDLQDGRTMLIVIHDEPVLTGLLLQTSSMTLSVVLNIALPRLLADVSAAVTD